MSDLIVREAQRRGKWQEFSEWAAPVGKAMEHFSPEFQEIMGLLRAVDTNVRSIATGEEPAELTSEEPDKKDKNSAEEEPQEASGIVEPGKTLKDLIRVAEANFKRREYMTAISYLGRFHERAAAINNEFAKLNKSVDAIHNKFLFEGIDPEQVKYITKNLAPRFRKDPAAMKSKLMELLGKEPKNAAVENAIIAEAGIVDWWRGLGDDRYKSLSGWEKRFPKKVREIKSQTSSMITRSQSLLSNLLTTLKQLNGFRNARKFEEYLQAASRWRERYRAYNSAFTSFFNSQIKDFLKHQAEQEGKNKAEKEDEWKSLLMGDGLPPEKNEPKDMPQPGATPGATPEVTPGGTLVSQQPDQGPASSLQEILTGPMPKWEELPDEIKRGFIQFQGEAKRTKPWDKLDEEEKRIAYSIAVDRINRARPKKAPKDQGVAFPLPAGATPPSSAAPVVSPPASAPESIPMGYALIPPAPASAPPSSAPPSSNEPFPLVHSKGPKTEPPEPASITEVSVHHPEIPPPPLMPKDLVEKMISDTPPGNDTSRGRRAHTEFLTELEAKASEHPIVQAAFVLDYAKEIEADEPEQCKRLRALASSILGK